VLRTEYDTHDVIVAVGGNSLRRDRTALHVLHRARRDANPIAVLKRATGKPAERAARERGPAAEHDRHVDAAGDGQVGARAVAGSREMQHRTLRCGEGTP
jgi:hypothetical protein